MTHDEHLLTILSEECQEVAQRVSKALRFGLDEIQPGQPLTNAERITEEVCDLLAMIELCQAHALIPGERRARIEQKKAKVQQFLQYSRECGTLTDETK